MKRAFSTRAQRLLPLLILSLALAAGCGHKGPVKPLEKPLPAPSGRLTALQQGDRFQLAWDSPKVNQDGSPMTDLQGFRIYKMKYNLAEDCPECRDTSELLREVDVDYLRNAGRMGERFFIWDGGLEYGAGYQYKIISFTRRGRDGAPATIRKPFFVPPQAPSSLSAEGFDRLVRLSWSPAAVPPVMQLLGYNIYRRHTGSPFLPLPVNSQVVTELHYDDFDLQNGETYSYTVRTVIQIDDTIVESAAAEMSEAMPQEGR